MTTETQWIDICRQTDLVANSGVCALFNGEQVALFYLPEQQAVFAIANFDPFGEANVLSRGLVGSIGDELVVASPLYKQHFCLNTGRCLEDASMSIKAWPARLHATQVQLLSSPVATGPH